MSTIELITHFVIVLRSESVIPEVLDPTTQSDCVSHMVGSQFSTAVTPE